MNEYPTIDRNIIDKTIYAFDKLDGSNIRAEWTRKNGFSKYGSRRCLIDERTEILGNAITIFKSKYEKQLSEMFKKERYERVICFLEYWSPNSFAGTHADEPHNLTLIDVSLYKKGLMLPNVFIRAFKDVETAKLLYMGNCNNEFVESVANGTLAGMTFEGVVCKSIEYKFFGQPFMFKLKNKAWIEKLKTKCNGDMKKFEELL